jgi:microcystin-dependent protein
MAEPYIGEIRTTGYTFAPKGWALCDGRLLPINQNTALFAVIGTYFGGNGTSNFALPDLRSLSALCYGEGLGLSPYVIGETGGVADVTLTKDQMAAHPHGIGVVDDAGGQDSPAGAALAEARSGRDSQLQYGSGQAPVPMNAQLMQQTGSSLPHNNMPPYLVVSFMIALDGAFPPRS